MGTYALGCFLQDQQTKSQGSEAALGVIRDLRNAGKLRALPIARTNKETGTLLLADGSELSSTDSREAAAGCASTPRTPMAFLMGPFYLGSATHAGHIELKALCVSVAGTWYNIISGLPQQ